MSEGDAHDFRTGRPRRGRTRGSDAGDPGCLLKVRVHTPGNLLRNLSWRAHPLKGRSHVVSSGVLAPPPHQPKSQVVRLRLIHVVGVVGARGTRGRGAAFPHGQRQTGAERQRQTGAEKAASE